MHAPPPPQPNLDPVDSARVVRPATPEEAWTFHKHDVAEVVRHAYEQAQRAAEAAAEAERRKDDLARELEAATTRLAEDARTPVLDERDKRQQSRTRVQR